MSLRLRIFRKRFVIAAAVLVALQMEGCYYMQAIRGHSDLMRRRQPVDEVIADEAVPEPLKEKLALVQEARDFAVTDLGLPDNGSYRSYADLERDYVVWNVFAAPEFSLAPKTWCYPVAGCVAYRGYFKEDAARKQKAKLESAGYDVMVGGVAAYSTLGRFEDPLLNTMIGWSEVDLIATMFHELAHQQLYVKGDSAFNESFATAVANIGIARWLETTGETDRLALYLDYRQLRRDMFSLVSSAKAQLETLYASVPDVDTLTDTERDQMRQSKQAILDGLSADAEALVEAHGRGRRNWLAPPLNNARLVSMNLYEGWVEAFNDIYDRCEQQLDCFYAQAEAIAAMPDDERYALLATVTDRVSS
jgi:predicted aminopeptidase